MVRTLRLLARGGTFSTLPFGSNNHGSKTVLWKEITVVYRSNIQHRGRSTAAAAPLGMPDSPKDRKRVTLKERRNMVEAYVKRYRDANSGKFPNATNTLKEVGGSYYTVKKMVQELEYQAKSGLSDSEVTRPKRSQPSKKGKSVTDSGEVSRTVTVDAGHYPVPVPKSDRLSDTSIVKEESTLQIAVGDHADVQVKKRDAKFEVEKDLTEQYENALKFKEETEGGQKASDDLAAEVEIGAVNMEVQNNLKDSGDTEIQKIQQHESSESEKPIKRTDDSRLPQRSSLWENLKSFADDIISLWRK